MMRVTMKELEKKCREQVARWNKKAAWDSYCVAKDTWLMGFQTAREDVVNEFKTACTDLIGQQLSFDEAIAEITKRLENVGNQPVEVEMVGNQIGSGDR